METLTLNLSFIINASTQKVWHALTEPEIVKQYFFGTKLETSWNVGDPITFSGEWDGKAYVDTGTILQIEVGKSVTYNYWSSFSGKEDKPENYANIVYRLDEEGNQTKLTVQQDRIADKEALEHSEQNWKMVVNSMKELIEK
ncbi:MAG: SRPBCC domain-containing protein [Cyclobacteriaceae bacterium]|nr:SRPBCC domain-containing protein [Cyclobacteriaceae bacterium]